jgi:hypothetical protein
MNTSESILAIIGLIVGAIVVAFGLSVLLAFPVKWLWNATLPELFAIKPIGVWMAWKISLLCSFLFKSFSAKSSS